MKKMQLLHLANEAYPDGFLAEYFDIRTGELRGDGQGDTLALFIVRELAETMDESRSDSEQVRDAVRVLEYACGEVLVVVNHLKWWLAAQR